MTLKLTIIIPCYNCVDTLEEAVASCFRQGLSSPFEIILVDDGSSDGTRILLEKIGRAHPEIKVILHEKNRGGGAARNTAIAHASGEIICCLDADDILPNDTLQGMIEQLTASKSDGVLFEETRFFKKNPVETHIIRNTITGRPIEIADFFGKDAGFLTTVNFVYTKKAFETAGGYPTHHGFDTQGFGLRFLAVGNKVTVAHGSAYLHRRHHGPSYFVREYNGGKLSFNSYLMLEDVFYLFSKKIKEEILKYKIYIDNKLGENNLLSYLRSRITTIGEDAFFIPNYKSYLGKDGEKKYTSEIADSNDPIDLHTQGLWLYKNQKFSEACEFYLKIWDRYSGSSIYITNIMQCFMNDEIVYKMMYIPPTPIEKLVSLCRKIKNRVRKNF